MRGSCKLLVAGGVLPTSNPEPFLELIDVVVRREGEQTMKELLRDYEAGSDLRSVAGIVFRGEHGVSFTKERAMADARMPASSAAT